MSSLEESTVANSSALPNMKSPTQRDTSRSLLGDDVQKELVQLFKLLADETRLRIVSLLVEAPEYHVRALCDLLDQSQPAVSHHLALLRTAGLIECRRQGKHNFYRLAPQRIAELLDLLFKQVDAKERRARLGDYLLSYSPSTDGPP